MESLSGAEVSGLPLSRARGNRRRHRVELLQQRTAQHIRDALAVEGLDVRIGVHVAEVEARGDDVAGLGVHIAARIMSAAAAGEILVSATIPAVAVGGDAEYEPRGQHTLKGVPGRWDLFAAVEKQDAAADGG